MYICMHVCMCLCLYIYLFIYIYIHIYTYIYIYIYIYIYNSIYIIVPWHTHTLIVSNQVVVTVTVIWWEDARLSLFSLLVQKLFTGTNVQVQVGRSV
jgi:hypothetical protein